LFIFLLFALALRQSGVYITSINAPDMQQLKATYQHYLNLHQDFNEEHRNISRKITSLYQLPKKFIEENEKAIQSCLAEKQADGSPHHADLSPTGIRDFLFVMEDFKLQTMELFFEHRVHIDKCTVYVMRVNELKEKHQGKDISETKDEYVELIPQLEEMISGLNGLLEKAEAMAGRLETIEARWSRINSKAQ
jgi:FtsZ-binding cell division protein ZapB